MDHPTCGPGARWCARADKMFAVPGMHVLDVGVEDHDRLVLSVESGQLEAGCPSCGVLAVGHGRRTHMLHDAPCFGRTTVLLWRKRVWRCREPLCATDTFSKVHDLAPPRALLTVRAVRWATDALAHDDTTVSALARHLGVDWHTCWSAVEVEARARVGQPERLQNVKTLGVDEHIWRPSRIGVDRAVTIMVDLMRDQAGSLHAGLLDAVVARSGTATSPGWTPNRTGSPPASRPPPSTRSGGMRTRSATVSPRPSPCWTRSMSCGWARRWSTRSAAASNRRRSVTAAIRTTRSTRSAACCATASSTSPRSSRTGSRPASTPATRPKK